MQKEEAYYIRLLSGFINNQLSAQEVEELFEFIRQEPENYNRILSHPAIRQQLSDKAFYSGTDISEEVSIRMRNRLLEAVYTEGEPAIPLFNRRWFRYAASVIIICTAAILFWNTKNKSLQRNTTTIAARQQNDVLPGSDKAILTVAGGKTIVLDNTQGDIIQEGNFKVVNQNGRLDYEGKVDVAEYHTVTTPRGGQFRIQLSDGTDVWLNAASSITFPTAFTGKERKVTVTGEVYFEVAKNKAKPFKVIANEAEIQVFGTHFNVNAYADEPATQTTLLEGSVKVTRGSSTAMLEPGQQATLNKSGEMSIVEDADIEMVMAWKNGFTSFKSADIRSIMRQVSRWYNVDVYYEGNIPERKFTGDISRNANLSQLLRLLEVSKIHFTIEKNRLTVIP